MTLPIISVNKLSKKYFLSSSKAETELRDVLSSAVLWPVNKLRRFLQRSTQNSLNDHLEQSQSNTESSEFWAIRNLSFTVTRGEVVGIIGRNGAGKSTLLKILARITEPTLGYVDLYGRVGSLLEVGTGFHPELTGRENVYLNGSILGMRRKEVKRKFDAIVEFAELAKFIDIPVKHYSSGMYTRLAFAVAAHLEPEIMIVDEVLAVGDAAFQKKCLGKMGQVSREGRTILFVSHNMAAVQQLTQRCIVLETGEIIYDGPTSGAVERYLNISMHNDNTGVYEGKSLNKYRHDADIEIPLTIERLARVGDTNGMYRCDSVIKFQICIKATEDTKNFRFSFTLYQSTTSPVGSFFSESNLFLKGRDTAVYELSLRDTRLAPGRYYCSVSVGVGDPSVGYRNFDCAYEVLHFEILPPDAGVGVMTEWSPNWGPIRFATPEVRRIDST